MYRGVYKGSDVAVKKQALKTGDEVQEKYLRSELEILTMVAHENLIRFYGASLSDGFVYIVTDFLKSGDLCNILKSDVHLSWTRRLKISLGVAQVCACVVVSLCPLSTRVSL